MTIDFPEIGVLIAGVYRVTGLLGAGGMGVVLEAHDETLDRTVAIKFVRPSMLDGSFRGRFQSEAQAMARVSHPNILQIYAFGEHEGAPYFVMEYVDGLTLDAWVESNGPLEPAVALGILEQICDGVAAIHAADTVHRDLKPSNVLMDRQGRARVADLGLAVHRVDEVLPSREVVGTPAYMAPEVAFPTGKDTHLSQSADIYSIGCMAYELLTGQVPFAADHPMALMCQHATQQPKRPSEICPALSPLVDEVVLKALAKSPEERIPTAQALGAALRAAADGVSEPTRLLVAEDSDDAREMIEFVLQQAFPAADIECVRNGREAVVAFDRKRPSVVILDLCMPELGGKELTSLLRERDPDWRIPLIVLTASGSPSDWKELRALGADRFLLKPVVLDDVVAMVRHLLKERSVSLPPSLPRGGLSAAEAITPVKTAIAV